MFWYLIMVIILVRLIAGLIAKVKWRFSMNGKLKAVAGLFVNNIVDSKVLFVTRFARVPSVGVITQMDATAAYALLKENLDKEIVEVHQMNMYDFEAEKTFFTVTIFELSGNRMIEIGNGYVEVLYTNTQYAWAMALLKELATCKSDAPLIEEEKVPAIIGFARAWEMN